MGRIGLHLTIFLVFTSLSLVSRQQVGAGESVTGELVVLAEGDLWSGNFETNEVTRLVDLEYPIGCPPALSPDATRIAFGEDVTGIFRDTQVAIYEGTPPTDIWILDRTSGEVMRIAEQPEDRSEAIERSCPVWSPDGRSVAWIEKHEIITYDVFKKAMSAFSDQVDYGYQDAGSVLPHLQWGAHLSISTTTFGFPEGQYLLYIYDVEGIPQRHFIGNMNYREDSAAYFSYVGSHYRWVEFDDEWWIGLRFNRGEDYLMHPTTGQWVSLSEPPTLQLADEPANALRLRLHLGSDPFQFQWEILEPDGKINAIGEPGDKALVFMTPVISPDGQYVTYATGRERTMMVWEAATAHERPLGPDLAAEGLAWAPMIWRANGRATPIPAPTPYPYLTQ